MVSLENEYDYWDCCTTLVDIGNVILTKQIFGARSLKLIIVQ